MCACMCVSESKRACVSWLCGHKHTLRENISPSQFVMNSQVMCFQTVGMVSEATVLNLQSTFCRVRLPNFLFPSLLSTSRLFHFHLPNITPNRHTHTRSKRHRIFFFCKMWARSWSNFIPEEKRNIRSAKPIKKRRKSSHCMQRWPGGQVWPLSLQTSHPPSILRQCIASAPAT